MSDSRSRGFDQQASPSVSRASGHELVPGLSGSAVPAEVEEEGPRGPLKPFWMLMLEEGGGVWEAESVATGAEVT